MFTGVEGNYEASIAKAGLDPDNLPDADKSKMNFGSGGNMKLPTEMEGYLGFRPSLAAFKKCRPLRKSELKWNAIIAKPLTVWCNAQANA